jgi:MFS family permease
MLYTPAFFAMAVANLACLASYSAFFLFPLFITGHGGDQADVGIIMGAITLSSVLCRPWISDMTDRLGRKRSYTIGAAVMTVLPLAYLFFDGKLGNFYLPLLLVRVVHGVGYAICITAAFTYVADIVPRERLNEGFGMFGVSGLVGTAIGPVLAELVLRTSGFNVLFLTASALAAVSLVIHLPLSETYRHVLRGAESSFFLVLQRKRVLTVAVLAVLFGFGLAAVNNFVPPYAAERGIAFISLYYVTYAGAAILTRLFGARFMDRLGEERIIPYGLCLIGAGLVGLLFLTGTGVLLASGFVTGFGHGLLYPALNARAIRGEPPAVRGKITGAYTGSIDAGVFAGSIGLGFLGDFAGFQALFLAAGAALFAGYFVFRRYSAPEPAAGGVP